MRGPGLEHGRGPDARLHEPRGARAHARERRDALLEPLARGALAQGRDLGQRAAGALAALRLRRRRPAGAGRAGRPRLSHGRADVLPPHARASRRWPSTRRCPRSRARSPSAGASCPTAATRPSSCEPGPSAIGDKVQEEAEEVARAAREESDERLREEAADVLYHLGVLLQAQGSRLSPTRSTS